MTSYTCNACGQPVVVDKDGTITRKCEHVRAGITAFVSATCTGVGAVSNKKKSPLAGFIHAVRTFRNRVLRK